MWRKLTKQRDASVGARSDQPRSCRIIDIERLIIKPQRLLFIEIYFIPVVTLLLAKKMKLNVVYISKIYSIS